MALQDNWYSPRLPSVGTRVTGAGSTIAVPRMVSSSNQSNQLELTTDYQVIQDAADVDIVLALTNPLPTKRYGVEAQIRALSFTDTDTSAFIQMGLEVRYNNAGAWFLQGEWDTEISLVLASTPINTLATAMLGLTLGSALPSPVPANATLMQMRLSAKLSQIVGDMTVTLEEGGPDGSVFFKLYEYPNSV